ncbi:MAG: bifunctional folylpolyglutamate synthase/dihydrofolate synthase [Chlorobiaceae bacterium]|nr:bifunctional folylpolyglutamate synthase/dihydrofolate synthase [Chlorobiaceae bacterium]
MTYQDALDYLFPLHRFGIRPGLDRVLELMEVLGSPHTRLGQIIHIAGTNGKGTTASAIASIFQASGRKTALYTSPHLIDFTERIRIDGAQIPREKVAAYCSRLKDAASGRHVTFFEATTAIAFAWFADEGVEVSVIETGMGGSLDATNVVNSDYAVIPGIGLDHTAWLGTTVSAISTQKAGIIKRGSRVFTAVQDPEAFLPVAEAAASCGAPLSVAGKDVRWKVNAVREGSLELDIRSERSHYPALQVPLTGAFHASNITLAVMVAEDAGVSVCHIRAGLERMLQTGYRARLEKIGSKPSLYLDVSHNPDGMRLTVDTLLGFMSSYRSVFILLGLASDKDARSIVSELGRLGGTFVTVSIPSERGLGAGKLAEICRSEGYHASDFENAGDGLGYLLEKAGDDDLLLVTGSFFLAGDILSRYL